MPRKTRKLSPPPHDAQEKLESRPDVHALVVSGKIKYRDDLPGIDTQRTLAFWGGYAAAMQQLAGFVYDRIPGGFLPEENAAAASES